MENSDTAGACQTCTYAGLADYFLTLLFFDSRVTTSWDVNPSETPEQHSQSMMLYLVSITLVILLLLSDPGRRTYNDSAIRERPERVTLRENYPGSPSSYSVA